MKDSINYYYNFNISEVENWNYTYRFKLYDDYFYFVPLKRNNMELDDIVLVSKELKTRGIEAHDIILNKVQNLVTKIGDNYYILLT